jgi:tRNA (adenine57-N1/adenine58-N1)-methyltransferase
MSAENERFKEGELCTVRIIKKNFLIKLQKNGVLHTNKGYIRHDDIIGKLPGERLLTNLNKPAYIFRPSLDDFVFSVKRFTNIIYPKEIAWIVYCLGLRNGFKVLEAGTGSGALTCILANFVYPDGKIDTFEVREDFIEEAEKNIERAGFGKVVEVINADISSCGLKRDYYDACILDLPEPWKALENIYTALKPGAPIVCFLPTVNQVEKTVLSMKKRGFLKPEVIEILHRHWDIKEGASRPEFEMRGHTGFLVQSRKILKSEDEIW